MMSKRLRSIGKMKWVWLALEESRNKERFWSNPDAYRFITFFRGGIDACKRMYPLRCRCCFCYIALLSHEWHGEITSEGCIPIGYHCRCVFSGMSCWLVGAELFAWLNCGCEE